MDWIECAQLGEYSGEWSRFEYSPFGFDCAPDVTTFNDIWGAIAWHWTWPGDFVLNLPQVRSFFELGTEPIISNAWSNGLTWIALFALVSLINQIDRL